MTSVTFANAQRSAFVAQVIRICQLIPTVVALYDHLITLDREASWCLDYYTEYTLLTVISSLHYFQIDLVWSKPWTIAKVLFLWNRYFSNLFLLGSTILFFAKPSSDELCVCFLCLDVFNDVDGKTSFILQGWGTVIIMWFIQSVMLFRTIAIFQHAQSIVMTCLLFYAVEIVSMAVILAASANTLNVRSEPFPGLLMCTPQYVPHFSGGVWIPAIIFDCGLCALSLWACLRHVNHLRGVLLSRSQMWEVLLTDTVLYFSVTLTASIANTVVWFVLNPEWLKLLQGFSTAATCVMGGRLVLNLRRAYYVYSPSDVGFGSFERRSPQGERMIPLRDIRFITREAPERSSSQSF
ncbi:hypothetical protein FPV67DRAFT_1776695 [Lyophyllum atratum]|nr:hypothetical protein FPV67DRAFT_1776695 [Lyophyllum atratum]